MAVRRTKAQKESLDKLQNERSTFAQRLILAQTEIGEKFKEIAILVNEFGLQNCATQEMDEFIDSCDIEDYGYTLELKESAEALEERLELYPAELPKIGNIVDQTKYEFFAANFAKIPLEALEWIVSTVDKNKLSV